MRYAKSPIERRLWEMLGLQPGVAVWFAVWQLSRLATRRERQS